MGQQNSRPRAPISPQYLRPQLYKRANYDERALRKAILDRKLAPCYPGSDDHTPETEECPICMLNYPGGLNRSLCCAQPICTECYLQVVPKLIAKGSACPFCKTEDYVAEFRGPLSDEAKRRAVSEEQRVIELQIESNVRQEKAYLDKLAAQGIAFTASPSGKSFRCSSLPGSPAAGTRPELPPALAQPADASRSGLPSSDDGASSLTASPSQGRGESLRKSPSSPLAAPPSGGSPVAYPSPTATMREYSASFEYSPRLVPAIDRSTEAEQDDYDRRWVMAQQAQDEATEKGSSSATASPRTVGCGCIDVGGRGKGA